MAVINEQMDASAELGRNPVSKLLRFSLSMETSRLTRDGTAERGQGNIYISCPADLVQDWQLTLLIHTLAICVTIIHTYIH